jgi:hypothetical protein
MGLASWRFGFSLRIQAASWRRTWATPGHEDGGGGETLRRNLGGEIWMAKACRRHLIALSGRSPQGGYAFRQLATAMITVY